MLDGRSIFFSVFVFFPQSVCGVVSLCVLACFALICLLCLPAGLVCSAMGYMGLWAGLAYVCVCLGVCERAEGSEPIDMIYACTRYYYCYLMAT